MVTGYISQWNADKGFGFIETLKYGSVFCHVSAFEQFISREMGHELEGEAVTLEVVVKKKGFTAKKVEVCNV